LVIAVAGLVRAQQNGVRRQREKNGATPDAVDAALAAICSRFCTSMQVSKAEAEVVRRAIQQWQEAGVVDGPSAERMRASLVVAGSARQQLAQYLIIIAVSCSLLAFTALFLDSKLLESFRRYFALSNIAIALLFGGIAAGTLLYVRRRLRTPGVMREALLILGSLAVLTGLVYFCKETGTGPSDSGLLGASAVLLGLLAHGFRSGVLAFASVAALLAAVGAATYAASYNGYFLGLAYPFRYAIVGALLLAAADTFLRKRATGYAQPVVRMMGLTVLLIALWAASIFGNYANFSEWADVRQTGMIPYALLFAAVGAGFLLWGIRRDDAPLRDLGLVALLVNGYTRAFEYFWDSINKGVFFLLLAVSFFLLGRWLGRPDARIPFFRGKEKPAANSPAA